MDFNSGIYFDFNLEDIDPKTNPVTGDPERHFRDLRISETDASEAISSCHKEKFERAMHRGQDYFVHYLKGYRWKPRTWGMRCSGYGHACDNTTPDEDDYAWSVADSWTKSMVLKWYLKCGCIAYD